MDEKLDRAEAWYRERGAPVLFQLTEAARPARLEDVLVARGYEAGSSVSVQTAPLDDVLERTHGEADVSRELDDAWIELWAGSRGFANLDVARAILTAGDAVFARVARSPSGAASPSATGLASRRWRRCRRRGGRATRARSCTRSRAGRASAAASARLSRSTRRTPSR